MLMNWTKGPGSRLWHIRSMWCIAAVMSALVMTAGPVDAAGPVVRETLPSGVQRGAESVVTIHGGNLDNPQELLLYDKGVTVKSLEANDKGNRVKVTLQVAADCKLGEQRARLRSDQGLSPLFTFYVGQYPTVEEKEPNNDFAAPQKVAMGSTVQGVIDNEDLDYFAVEAKKGQRVSVEIEAIRLGGQMTDPYVAILDSKRFELDSADDTPLLKQDGYASVIAPEDGVYTVLVRDSAYGGGNRDRYRVHIGDFPRPAMAYPAGGRAGHSIDVTYLGDVTGPIKAKVKLPEQPQLYAAFAEQDGKLAPSPNYMRASPFDDINETEPNNNNAGEANEVPHEAPFAVNGIIQEPGDQDNFKFKAKKGQNLEIRVYARDFGSPLDPVTAVISEESNDDNRGSLDSYVNFRPKKDGEYTLIIRDHLRSGGPNYVYRIEVTPREPKLSFFIPDIDNRDTQSRKMASIPKGNYYAVLLQADRDNFGGELKILADNLPPGVTMHVPNMKDNVNQVPVVFEAKEDAELAGSLVHLHGKHADEKKNIGGDFRQTVTLVAGNPNRTAYYTTTVDRFTASVTKAAPFKVRIEKPKTPLLQNGRMNLKVVAERKEGFDEPIKIEMLRKTPGFNCRSSVTIPKGKNEVDYPVNARGNAATGTWKMAMVASAEVPLDKDGKKKSRQTIATPLQEITIDPEFVVGKTEMAVTEQGKPIDVIVKLDQRREFEGEATLELHGLPNKVKTEPIKITKDTKEVAFKVTTEKDSPVGQHKSLFCQFVLPHNGENMVQSLAGGGVLRIDKPRPEPKEKPEKKDNKDDKKPEAKKKEEPPKRLSRLEQLRLEAEKRAKAAAGGN